MQFDLPSPGLGTSGNTGETCRRAVREALESLDRLGLDAVDLLYVHWPTTAYDSAETLRAMDDLHEAGVTRPLLRQETLGAYAREHGHHLVAYAPLGGGRLGHPTLDSIAEKHGASVPQVCLAWALAREGVVPIPKATGDHIRENWAARDLHLDDADHERIAAIDETRRLFDREGMDWE